MTGDARAFVIRREYGQLIEGWRESRAALEMAILAGDEEAARELVAECAEWSAVMGECRMLTA